MARTFYQIIIIACTCSFLGCDGTLKKKNSSRSSVSPSSGDNKNPIGSCHLSLNPDPSPFINPENWLEDWTKPRTQEFCESYWKNFITTNPPRQKIVYSVTSNEWKDFSYRFVDTVDISNDDTLNIDTETIVAQLNPVYVEGVILNGANIEIKRSGFISRCTSQGLAGIQIEVEMLPSGFGTFRYNSGWRDLQYLDKAPSLVTNQIESITVPAGTFSSRHIIFRGEKTLKGVPVNQVYQFWLSGIGVAERILKMREHVELPSGEEISWELSELAFCGWQETSDL